MPFSRFGEKVYVAGRGWQDKKRPNSLSPYFPRVFTLALLVAIVGFFVSLASFLSAFSSWFGKNPPASSKKAPSLIMLQDNVEAKEASGELLEFSRAGISPSDLRVSKELQWPVRGYITNGFSGYHQGVDIGASYNTPIYPLMAGKVIKVVYNGANLGNYAVISHRKGLTSLYAHMNFVAVRKGETISLGDKIGSIGLTGYTTGPHLHLSVYLNARAINPLLILR